MGRDYTLLFINGLYRSGTTFFSRVMDAFPSAYIYEDAFRIPYFYLLDCEKKFVYPRDMQKRKTLRLNSYPQNLSAFKENLQKEIENIPINEELKKKLFDFISGIQNGKTFIEIFQSIFDLTQEYSKALIVGTKTTYQHNYINYILKFFPYAKWIEIIRDPRAIYCSAKKSHNADLKFICDVWNNATEAYFNIESKYADRFFLIKYEDLVLDTENTLHAVKNFLNLDMNIKDFLRDLSLKRNDGSNWFSNSSYKPSGILVGDVGVKTAEYFDKKPALGWQKILNELEKRIILNRCKANMKKIGFSASDDKKGYSFKDIFEVFVWFFEISTLRFILREVKSILLKNKN